MLIILTTHPIQYQIPLWQALAKDGRVPFEVWYLTKFGTKPSQDQEFGKSFVWDIELLGGYPHRFLDVTESASPNIFWQCRLRERLRDRLRVARASALWIQGWQVAGYWQAVWEAQAAGVEVWLRGESNDLAPTVWWKQPLKRILLGEFFKRVQRFLYIGTANKRFYQKYNITNFDLHSAPYAIDNDRFARQAEQLRGQRNQLRKAWGIPTDAFCLLFCGKFVAKKRPMDLIGAARMVRLVGHLPNIHLLFVGAGELGADLRRACTVIYDAERCDTSGGCAANGIGSRGDGIPASFAGFLNQTEISRAYVAADCLVLPSDHGETWGLVVNEALASGLACIVSDACGCAEDLILPRNPEWTFRCGHISGLAEVIIRSSQHRRSPNEISRSVADHSFGHTVQTAVALSTCAKLSDRLIGRADRDP
jgi:glycosyltransferase involved in cell wall biosynthesis